MDIRQSLSMTGRVTLRTVSMHTTGEPTRIIVSGYPSLEGTSLLEKRQFAREKCDHIRRILMHEPRGHRDMYGAILVQDTEYVRSGDADIGVLFIHNDGYSTMCGHATIALGRFLIDTHTPNLFPNREKLRYSATAKETYLNLHAPCGVVRVAVPSLHDGSTTKSDPSRPVSFLSVPSFAVAINLSLKIPEKYHWPELSAKHLLGDAPQNALRSSDSTSLPSVTIDIAYGGAFYAIVSASELGFPPPTLEISGEKDKKEKRYDRQAIDALDHATMLLKRYIQDTPELAKLLTHPTAPQMEFLYGVTVVDDYLPSSGPESVGIMDNADRPMAGSDVNICFFANQQLDRSPTGSCVSARVALAVAKRELKVGESWEYHSVVSAEADRHSERGGREGAFVGTAVEHVRLGWGKQGDVGLNAVVVKVEGKAWYIGSETFVVEEGDLLGEGFVVG
ncbi:Diaminopimelate epimerase-like protein [Rickenella mellea]|uniref:trans-L-3-hydroxyproline dehydratase n=1 Tax=Rickenella mellea TaxID=50990 RepID=A0A4Y7PVH5_9AGAM|nr:Diaminopimelate epimerase-like protein [Rickenella mellea]